jgi:voltage-gated potassium channel
MDFRQSQFYQALKLLAVLFIASGLGFQVLDWFNPDVDWSTFDCYYFSVITLTTTGFGETLAGMDQYPAARMYTMILLMFGAGFLVYAASAGTAYIVEGELGHFLERRRMEKAIAALDGHFIVCGAGQTGINVVRELIDTGQSFVAIERHPQRLERLREVGCRLAIEGDATSDEVLRSAGIERARGLASCLGDDRDNLFVTVSARQLNPRLRIIAKNVERTARDKLIHAGASQAVSPALIGGLRLASELIRPAVVTFLDGMLRDREKNVRFAEVSVEQGSEVAGRTLGESRLQERVGLPVLALRHAGASATEFLYNPGPDERLEPGVVLVVMGPLAQVQALETLARA